MSQLRIRAKEMRELKTLKDLSVEFPENLYYVEDKEVEKAQLDKSAKIDILLEADLREEAKKWIKELTKTSIPKYQECLIHSESEFPKEITELRARASVAKIEFIKQFFNLEVE